MTAETAAAIQRFCRANEIGRAEMMGGEFYTHPDWEEILHILSQGLTSVRLVSNGDWAGNAAMAAAVLAFLKQHPQFTIGLSKDKWHTNRHVRAAAGLLEEAGVRFRLPTAEETRDDSIVPLGRSRFDSANIYGMFSRYCDKPERRYSFLIDEVGQIFKCGFGAWPYAHVEEFEDGGFAARFKDFKTHFYGVFLSSCSVCQRAEAAAKQKNATSAGNQVLAS